MNEKLIAYLEKQKAEREAVLAAYLEAKAALAEAEEALAKAREEVESFGDIDAVEAERAEIQGFIESLIPDEAPVEEETEVASEDVTEEVCAECTVPEGAPATPAAPFAPARDVFDGVM